MKKNLLSSPSNLFMILQPKSNVFLYTLLLVFCLGFNPKTEAQCAYQFFDSFRSTSAANKTAMIGEGWTFSAAAGTPATLGYGTARTGLNGLSVGNAVNNNVVTPTFSNPSAFTFYYRNQNTTNTVNFTVDWFDGTSWSATIPFTTALGGGYTGYTLNFPGGTTSAKVRFNITGFSAGAPALYLDDLSCISSAAANNNKVVPDLGGSYSCGAGTPNYVPDVASGNSFTFYDQGGSNDIYMKSQGQTLYFAPTSSSEKVQLTLTALGLDALSLVSVTTITIYNGNGTGGPVLGTITNATAPALNTKYTANNPGDYITVVFSTYNGASSLTAAYTGFVFNVKCIAAPTITSFPTAGCDGSTLTITGTNLTGATAASFNGVAATLGANTSTSLTITPQSGSYGSTGVVSITNPGGTVTSVATYTSNALPSVSITGATAICASGGTTTLSPTTLGTWASSNTGFATVTNAGVVTGVAAGSPTFTFTSSSAPNCANTTSAVTVTALPAVSAAASVCIGSTINLSPNSGGNWTSSDATKASVVAGTGVVTGVAAGSATFTFTSSTAPNCVNTTSAVTVNAVPVVSTPASSICVGGSITLSPTTGGTWTSSDSTKATVTNAGVVSGVAAGSVTFTFLNTTTNCSATTSSVTVNALPSVSITGATAICASGGTTTLSPTTLGTWASSNTSFATVTNAGVVTGVAAGSPTFTFTSSSAPNCANTTSAVTVTALPVVSAAASVCIGSTINLSPNSGGTWTSSDATKASVVAGTGVVTGVATGSATFTFTSSTAPNCFNTTSAVAVNAVPVVSAGSSVCVGSTITLSPTTGGTWTSSDATKATVTNAGVVTGVAGGSATFTFLNTTTNCSATTSSVTINTPPASAPVATAATVIATTSFSANWNAVAGATGYYLDVATDAGFTAMISGSPFTLGNVLTSSVTGLSLTTNYYYRVRATNGCPTANSNTISCTTLGLTYCTPTYSSGDALGDEITNVTLGTLNNSSGASASPYYTFFNAFTIPNIMQSSTVTVYVTMGSDGNQFAAAWIDFNQNGTFETTEGVVSTVRAGTNGTAALVFNVPSGAVLGNTRMRVRGGNDSILTTSQACGASSSGFGETEDYIVTIIVSPVCSAPTAQPTVLGLTPASNTISGSFTAASPASDSYLVVVSTSNTPTAPVNGTSYTVGSALGAGTIVDTDSNTTFTCTSLLPSTLYYVYVYAMNAVCTGGPLYNTVSPLNGSTTTSVISYCTPTVSVSSATYITDFTTTGGVTNISNTGTGFSTNGYGDYTAKSASQYISSSVSFSVGAIAAGSVRYTIWVDWNRDGVFDPIIERVFSFQGNTSPQVGSFTVPATATIGTTRMRVMVDYWFGENPCAFDTTGTTRGEVEDYTFNVLAIPPCALGTPSALTSSNIDSTSATVSWTDATVTPSTTYDYYVSTSATAPIGTTIPTGNVVGTTSVSLTGLTLGNTYYVWVRGNCGGTYNAWVGSINFITVTVDVVTMITGSITTCNALFYDSGGPGSTYTNNQNRTFTFSPGVAGSKIKVVFSSFATHSGYDFLTVYNGPTTASPSLGTFSGIQIASGQVFNSTDSSGALTFKFTSNGWTVGNGWAANVSCVTLPVVSSFTPSITCAGTTPVVTITGSNFTGASSVKFNGVAASSFTIVNDTTITATLPVGATSGVVSVGNPQITGYGTTFTVKPLPTAVNAGSDVTICGATSTNLSGSFTATASTLIDEHFEGGVFPPAGWSISTTNSSFTWSTTSGVISGISASVDWDFSAQNEVLKTPSFSLLNAATANLAFNVALNNYWFVTSNDGDFLIKISTDGGGSWTTLQDETSFTYSGTGFQTIAVSIPLSGYVGNNNVMLSFNYVGINADSLYLDDVVLTTTPVKAFSWSPSTNLSSSSIYNPVASPTTTQTYTMTATMDGCSVTDDVIVTVTPIVAGTASSDQSICGGSPADIILTGSSGTIQWQSADNFAFTTNMNPISGATSSTLTSAQMGALTTNRYYRAMLTNGSCTLYSNIVTILISGTTTTWTGSAWSNGNPSATKAVVFNGTYSSDPLLNSVTPGNISACSISVTALGSVDIIAGHTVTVQNTVTVATGGSLTFEDGSSLYQPNAVTNATGVFNGGNSGNITFMRTASPMYKFDYTYWSSPVYPQNLLALSPLSPLFYQYDGVTANQWQYVNAGSTVMSVGRGYLVRAPSNFPIYVTPLTPLPSYYTGSFIGVPNNGSQSIQIGVAQGVNQFNLIGNPYPSSLLADNFIMANPNVGALYFWTHNTNISAAYQYTNDDYAVYTLAGGVGTRPSGVDGAGVNASPTGFIASGQGFFTKGVASITGAGPTYYATFTNSMRTAGNNGQFFKTNSTVEQNVNLFERHRYWLNINNEQGAFRQVLVGYIETATMGIDRLFEGQMSESSNVISLYTLVDSNKMAIQGRPLPFDVSDTVPLCYKSTIASTYTIEMPEYDGLFTSQHVYLEDTLLQVIHDLSVSPYTFATESGTFENRFILRYTMDALGTPVFNESSVVVYRNEQGLFIHSGTVSMQAVKIYDIRGRLLTSRDAINATETSFTTLPATQQVLLVQITSEEGISVTKKVVY